MARTARITSDQSSGRPLISKLGIREGHRLLLVDIDDSDPLRTNCTDSGAELVSRRMASDVDVVLFRADLASGLFDRFQEYRGLIRENGMIWSLWKKGGELRRDEIRHVGLSAGLVDTKVCSYSEELSGLKFVIPVADRRA